MNRTELLSYMRSHKLVVIGTSGAGSPQGALVGIGVADDLQVIFDTVSDSRKHQNLQRDSRVAVTFAGLGERTLQYEGRAIPVNATGMTDADYREIYFSAWPECRAHLVWPKIAYWRIEPGWARYSDYDRGPLIEVFTFEQRSVAANAGQCSSRWLTQIYFHVHEVECDGIGAKKRVRDDTAQMHTKPGFERRRKWPVKTGQILGVQISQ
jgi:pyridoxamine 5'-phosphate oxidase-like protein